MYDVVVVGAGAAGYGCAITLASASHKFDWAIDKQYLMIDDGNSDINKASFYNLTGVAFGINGDELLSNMDKQLQNFSNCKIKNDTVLKIKSITNGYEIVTTHSIYSTKIVVLATGMHKFDIDCQKVTILSHTDVLKPNKIYLENNNNKIDNGLYVAGLASGTKTMFAIANGDGVKVACDIFQVWTNTPAIVHDVIKK